MDPVESLYHASTHCRAILRSYSPSSQADKHVSCCSFLSCKNVELTGPLVLDGDPFGFSQVSREAASCLILLL